MKKRRVSAGDRDRKLILRHEAALLPALPSRVHQVRALMPILREKYGIELAMETIWRDLAAIAKEEGMSRKKSNIGVTVPPLPPRECASPVCPFGEVVDGVRKVRSFVPTRIGHVLCCRECQLFESLKRKREAAWGGQLTMFPNRYAAGESSEVK